MLCFQFGQLQWLGLRLWILKCTATFLFPFSSLPLPPQEAINTAMTTLNRALESERYVVCGMTCWYSLLQKYFSGDISSPSSSLPSLVTPSTPPRWNLPPAVVQAVIAVPTLVVPPPLPLTRTREMSRKSKIRSPSHQCQRYKEKLQYTVLPVSYIDPGVRLSFI